MVYHNYGMLIPFYVLIFYFLCSLSFLAGEAFCLTGRACAVPFLVEPSVTQPET